MRSKVCDSIGKRCAALHRSDCRFVADRSSVSIPIKQDLTRWENQIASARLVRFARERRKVPARQIERRMQATPSQKKQRLYLRFGGRPPKQWHAVHYGRKKVGERIDTSS